jgi:MFS family permease
MSDPQPKKYPSTLSEREFDQVFEREFRDRFPKPSASELVQQAGGVLISAGISLWGLIAQGWGLLELGIFVAADFLVVFILNWVCIIFLPVALTQESRNMIRNWIWAGFTFLILAALFIGYFYAFEGRGPWKEIGDAWGTAVSFLSERHMIWPLIALAVSIIAQFVGDVLRWQQRGGHFIYWSGVMVLLRIFFIFIGGIFAAVLIASFEVGFKAAWLGYAAWAVLLAVDIFLVWMPVQIHINMEKAEKEKPRRRLP